MRGAVFVRIPRQILLSLTCLEFSAQCAVCDLQSQLARRPATLPSHCGTERKPSRQPATSLEREVGETQIGLARGWEVGLRREEDQDMASILMEPADSEGPEAN